MATYAGGYSEDLQDRYGNGFSNAKVAVQTLVGAAVTLYADRAKTAYVPASGLAANEIKADDKGNLSFFAEPGNYQIVVTPSGASALPAYPVSVPRDPLEQDFAIQSYTSAQLDAVPPLIGRAAYVTDDLVGPWWGTGEAWSPGEPGINVRRLGAKGDGTDEQAFFEEAMDLANRGNNRYPILIPPGEFKYVLNASLEMFDGMTWIAAGSARGSEFPNRVIVQNRDTDLFSFPGGDVEDITLQGIYFLGHSTNRNTHLLTPADQATGPILRYSDIRRCAFEFFNKVIYGRILYTHILGNFFNNTTLSNLDVVGSDSIISDNNMGSPYVPSTDFIFKSGLGLSRIERNFITGGPAMAMRQNGSRGTLIRGNWLEAAVTGGGISGSGLYLVNGAAHVVNENWFSRTGQAPFDQYGAACTIYDCVGVSLQGNMMNDIPVGAGAGPWRIGETTTCSDIRITGTVYRNTTPALVVSGSPANVDWLDRQEYTTATRPGPTVVSKGRQIYDSTLNKPIWSTGSVWVDASGATV